MHSYLTKQLAEFQSSPDLQVGRYSNSRIPCIAPKRFNPRPTFRSGATTPRGSSARNAPVSILARPSGRALRPVRGTYSVPCWFQSSPDLQVGRYACLAWASDGRCCFNPRPTFRSGATPGGLCAPLQAMVSILARPSGRALLLNVSWCFVVYPVFQSSPDLQVGRYDAGLRRRLVEPQVSILARPSGRALHQPIPFSKDNLMFQSSPDLQVGRYAA